MALGFILKWSQDIYGYWTPGNRMNQKDRKPDYRVEYGEEWKPEKTSKWFWILLIAIIGALVAIS